MKILIFGKNGQVARSLADRVDPEMAPVFLDRAAADLEQPGACAAQIAEHAPDMVINAAAYTDVDGAEAEPARAHQVNALAPAEMARACADLGAPFIHISTDYVFDGAAQKPYVPDAPVAPINVYGQTKLRGEEELRAIDGRIVILRTSWVFSPHGRNFVTTMLRLSEARDRLNIVDDQIGGPTPAAAIADAVLRIGAGMVADTEKRGGLYHFAGAPVVSRADFAREIFAQAGRDVTIEPISTADFPTPARRPLYSALDCASLEVDFAITQPDWRAALGQFIGRQE